MKIKAIGQLVKTNPIQTQSNPISERVKIDAKCVFTKDYENISDWTRLATWSKQTQTNPISVPLAPFIVYNSRTVQEEPIHKFGAPRP